MTCCAIRGATTLRTAPTKCAGRALFDEDATPCAPSVLSASRLSPPMRSLTNPNRKPQLSVFRASDRLPDRTRKSGLCPDC